MAASVRARVSYEEDLYAWSLGQAALLRARRTEGLDWIHLAEEIEWMVGRDQRELKNRLKIILLHLLKWQVQPARRGANGGRACAPSGDTSGICYGRVRASVVSCQS